MSRDSLEQSQQDSQPVELYVFMQGSTPTRYTNAPAGFVFGGSSYSPRAITRSNVTCANTVPKDTIEIKLPYDDTLVQTLSTGMAFAPTTVTVARAQLAVADDSRIIWKGRVAKVGRNQQIATLTCEPVFSSLQRFGIYQPYQRLCRHVFGGKGCFVNRATYTTDMVVSSVSGANVVLTGTSLPNYIGGTLTTTGGDERMVIGQDGMTVTLMRPISSIVADDHVSMCLGCDRSIGTCNSTFGNAGNFGGFPGIPLINPFNIIRTVY